MPTPIGNTPLKCKTYNNVMNPDRNILSGPIQIQVVQPNNNQAASAAIAQLQAGPAVCNVIAASCITNDRKISQSMFSFSGPAVQCLTETIAADFL